MIKKLDFRLRETNKVSIFHDSRRDAQILIQICNLLKSKVNELTDEVNRLKQKTGAPICPVCGKDLFRGGMGWRCLHSSASYSEHEYIIRPGEMPVRKQKGGSDHETLPKP